MSAKPDQPQKRAPRSRRGNLTPEVILSKALSKTLRHKAVEEGLTLDANGYANVGELMAMSKFQNLNLTLPLLRSIVEGNDKQRFTLSLLPAAPENSEQPEHYQIRANQGHSIALSSEALGLERLLPENSGFPEEVVHGTFYGAYEAILESGGLKRMGRQHMHFTAKTAFDAGMAETRLKGKKGGVKKVISGMRGDAQIVFVVDAKKAAEEGGIAWWRSKNDVILTEGDKEGVLELQYVKRVESTRGLGVLWEDGEKRRELPAKTKKTDVPQGKEFLRRIMREEEKKREKTTAAADADGGKSTHSGSTPPAVVSTSEKEPAASVDEATKALEDCSLESKPVSEPESKKPEV